MKLTKSRYVEYTLCPKKAWYNLFDKIEEVQASKRGEEGTRIGKTSMKWGIFAFTPSFFHIFQSNFLFPKRKLLIFIG